MAEKKYLNDVGLADVANHVNTRLKTVTTMPVSADDGAVRLYIGTTDSNYIKGHTYQYSTSETKWIDITKVDDALSSTSINPVQNKVVKVALDTLRLMPRRQR